MLRTFLWYFTIACILVITIPVWILAKLFPGKDPARWPERVIDFFMPLVYKIAGFKSEVSGLENLVDGPAVYVGNHQGLFDMVMGIYEIRPLKIFLAKKEAEKIPFIGSWMKMFGCVFIERGNPRKSLESINDVIALLKQGKSVILYPEGTRSRKHEMGVFKPGAFRPAVEAGVPIVPFVVDGTYKAWEENHKITPATASLKILKPIYPEEFGDGKTKHISDKVYEMIQKELD